ncbi:zinc transporter [Actinomyces weissii]|uniref:Zinc transporter n=1 Tax=Actinomyces weissii TaxID=675090 RepID=A0A7T7S2F7_9ACTO|nr:zinc transporter [Actinomyces weissii]QQM67981.1 zinc transporter [Actinomyces weissii]
MDDPEVYFQVWNACRELPAEPVAPGGPQPALQPGGKRVVTVTRSQVARLLVGGSGITRQPPSLNTRLGMPLIVYTNPSPQTLSTTVLDTPVTITATPKSYTWSWGDGTTTTTTDPGHPYPNHSVYHYYQAPAQGLHITLTTSWSATYTTPEGTTRPVAGTITTTSTTTAFNVKDYTAVLTDEAEEEQGR